MAERGHAFQSGVDSSNFNALIIEWTSLTAIDRNLILVDFMR